MVITNTLYPIISIEKTYEAVYINDLEADWNYYYGLNYVNSNNGTLPSGEYQNIYNESNLVPVVLSYSGTEVFGADFYTGTVSLTETQSEFVYYKYYPIGANGKVKIELIDNPFTNRPIGKGFNNWVSYNGIGNMSFDTGLYKRYIELDVSYIDGIPQRIEVALYATWVDAAVSQRNGSINWTTAFNSLNNKGMARLATSIEYENQSMAGYYIGKTLSGGTSLARIL